MKKSIHKNSKLKIATDDSKTPFEIYSIILRGVMCTIRSIFKSYYVSENIEALMKFISDKKVLTPEEYKKLLSEAKDFYPVIICALFIEPLRLYTKNFKERQLEENKKIELFSDIRKTLTEFFIDWLCDIEIEPLLFSRLGRAYDIPFSIELCISKQISHNLTALEERVLKLQIIDILTVFLIEQVAVQLGLAGLDYIDFYKNQYNSNKVINEEVGQSVSIQ